MKKFNINHSMYVQITDSGWQQLEKTVGHDYIKACIKPYEIIINNEVWYKLQCWGAFDLMPPNFGGQPPFNTNVMFDDTDLIDPIKEAII